MADAHARVSIRERLCIETQPAPCSITLFGASGDLAHRKIFPSLARLYARNLLPKGFFLMGCGRTPMDDDAFRNHVRSALENTSIDKEKYTEFLSLCYYQTGAYDQKELYESLAKRFTVLENTYHTEGNRIFYFSLPPHVYTDVIHRLSEQNLLYSADNEEPWSRVVLEKPYGKDTHSARILTDTLHAVLTEKQIYRIDHYLGKETVQNILLFRFANTVFEPVWNAHYIDNVQITVAEEVGVESRASYFDTAGVLRDMFQNHMLELLSLVAMDQPAAFTADDIRDEKMRVLKHIRPFTPERCKTDVIRAQYVNGHHKRTGEPLPGYQDEKKVADDSTTETFAAMKMYIDSPRWQNVPFYLRSGKRLCCKKSEIVIFFSPVAYSIFPSLTPDDLTQNVLIFHIQPNEGINLTIQAKRPGPKLCICDLNLDVAYSDVFDETPPDAYERLLLDCMNGDQTLFTRYDNVAAAWELMMPLLNARENEEKCPLFTYPAGTWGPNEAHELVARDDRHWQNMCKWCGMEE